MNPSPYAKYCPICGRHLEPVNIWEFETGKADGLIYVHDDIPHGDDDIDALEQGVQ